MRPTDVDSKGNAIKKKKTNKFGYKKKTAKDITAVMQKKPVRKIVEFYYFLTEETDVRALQAAAGAEYYEQADIWPDINLMEVVMQFDSLIFQDASECFEDPEDMKYFEEKGIVSKYQISYDTGDIEEVRKFMKKIMTEKGGIICSDTDDFEPSFNVETVGKLN